jgi:hypothetical protein
VKQFKCKVQLNSDFLSLGEVKNLKTLSSPPKIYKRGWNTANALSDDLEIQNVLARAGTDFIRTLKVKSHQTSK